jgi:hypothetical protein
VRPGELIRCLGGASACSRLPAACAISGTGRGWAKLTKSAAQQALQRARSRDRFTLARITTARLAARVTKAPTPYGATRLAFAAVCDLKKSLRGLIPAGGS